MAKWSIRIVAGFTGGVLWLFSRGLRETARTRPLEVALHYGAGLAGILILFVVFFWWTRTRVGGPFLAPDRAPGADLQTTPEIVRHRRIVGLWFAGHGVLVIVMALLAEGMLRNFEPAVVAVFSKYFSSGQLMLWGAAGVVLMAIAHGLLNWRAWGRYLGLAAGLFLSFQFPHGLILGTYAWWLLSKPDVAAAYRQSDQR